MPAGAFVPVYFGAAKHLGMNLSGETAAVIVFTFWELLKWVIWCEVR